MATPYITSVSFGNEPVAKQLANSLSPQLEVNNYGQGGGYGGGQQQGSGGGGIGGTLAKQGAKKLINKGLEKLFGLGSTPVDASTAAANVSAQELADVAGYNALTPGLGNQVADLAAYQPAIDFGALSGGGGTAGIASGTGYVAPASVSEALGTSLTGAGAGVGAGGVAGAGLGAALDGSGALAANTGALGSMSAGDLFGAGGANLGGGAAGAGAGASSGGFSAGTAGIGLAAAGAMGALFHKIDTNSGIPEGERINLNAFASQLAGKPTPYAYTDSPPPKGFKSWEQFDAARQVASGQINELGQGPSNSSEQGYVVDFQKALAGMGLPKNYNWNAVLNSPEWKKYIQAKNGIVTGDHESNSAHG